MTENADAIFSQAQKLLASSPPDYAAALPLLTQAAEAGHAEAAFRLGGCILYGMGTRPSLIQATYWLRTAAELGHQAAAYNLALLRESNGVDVETVLPVYLKLAEKGHTDAQIRVMHYYAEHKNNSRAVYWAEKAAQSHHPQAQLFLAQHYQNSSIPNLPAAHYLYQAAAEQGMVSAHWQLANQFLYGQGVEQNHTQALYHLRIAAEAGMAAAQAQLGKLLLDGVHVPAEPQTALKWLEKAAGQQNADACAFLAQQHLTGIHLPRDYKAAARYALAAAEHNHPEALRLLGDICQYGMGIKPNADKAQEYYHRAAKLGDIASQQKLLLADALGYIDNPEYSEEVIERHQAAERNYQAGFALHYGIGCPQDSESALVYYNMAARQGHPKAQTNLGMMYYTGQGIEPDPYQAVFWFGAAAHQGDSVAQYNLAYMYYTGTGVARDLSSACNWLQTAIDNGHEQPEKLRAQLQEWLREKQRKHNG
ncbi:MAG: tetratricopeptide repeat protein [Neisseria sp.]|nr:tetratricopeptide repeat protein [Neisseria sp.]